MFGSRQPSRRRKALRWEHAKLEPGKPVKGFLAGATVWVECHFSHGTKACRSVLTGGKLKCAFAHSQIPPEWKGYVPLWDANGIPFLVIISADYYPAMANVRHLQPVWVTKTKLWGNPIKIEPSLDQSGGPPLVGADACEQDIHESLLRLWKDKELSDWVRANPKRPDATAFKFGETTNMSPMLRAAAERAEVTAELLKRRQGTLPQTIGDTASEVIAHLPSLNGRKKR